MAKVYLRMSELIKAMEEDVNKGAKMLAEATTEYLYDKTQEKLYEEMSPGEYYQRTGQVLNSITLSFRASAGSYRIMFDGRKIRPVKGNNGNFNAHADFDFNQSPKSELIEGLEKGHPVPNAPDREGAFMLKYTKNWLRSKIRLIISKTGVDFSDAVRISI